MSLVVNLYPALSGIGKIIELIALAKRTCIGRNENFFEWEHMVVYRRPRNFNGEIVHWKVKSLNNVNMVMRKCGENANMLKRVVSLMKACERSILILRAISEMKLAGSTITFF